MAIHENNLYFRFDVTFEMPRLWYNGLFKQTDYKTEINILNKSLKQWHILSLKGAAINFWKACYSCFLQNSQRHDQELGIELI